MSMTGAGIVIVFIRIGIFFFISIQFVLGDTYHCRLCLFSLSTSDSSQVSVHERIRPGFITQRDIHPLCSFLKSIQFIFESV